EELEKSSSKKIKDKEAKHNSTILLYSIICLFLVISVILLIVLYIRIFKKHKKTLSTQKEDIVLSHHILKNFTDGLVITNCKGEISYKNITVNKFCKKDKNITTIYDIIPELNRLEIEKLCASLKTKNNIKILEFKQTLLSGKTTPIELTIETHNFNNQNILSFFIKNISYRKNSERKLRKAKEAAEISDKLKSYFIANISHEIRTPVNAIVGFIDPLKEKDITTEEREKYLHIIEKSSDRLIRIIDKILDISLIESGDLKIEMSETNIRSQINDITYHYNNIISDERRDVTFKTKFESSSEPLFLKTDPTRLYQILNNLLSNAVKFTEKGEIELGYFTKEKSIIFYVRDTGSGIPTTYHDNIFKTFSQADLSHTRKHGGTGLGLAICYKLIEKLKGKIWFEAEENFGSTFYIQLPYDKSLQNRTVANIQPNNTTTSTTVETTEIKILHYNESESSNNFIKAILKKDFPNLLSSASAKDISVIINEEEKLQYAIINLDILPSQTEWFLKTISSKHPETIIIGLGNNDFDSKLINHHIKNPIKKNDILDILKQK
ncbi:MAG: ATP-binding protein, partial [Bacteroidota bacterium]|nr:ATP-binding protein [Bacteroidota bacterium]